MANQKSEDSFQSGDRVKLLHPYQPMVGQVSGCAFGDPRLYQIDCVDGTRLPYVRASELERVSS